MQSLKPGMYEYEVQAFLEAAFTRNGSERPGFPSIVGSGLYSTILHYSENHKQIEAGDLVVCDIGAEYSLYTADITRTFPPREIHPAPARDLSTRARHAGGSSRALQARHDECGFAHLRRSVPA